MVKNKKGDGNTFWIVISIVLAVLVLLLLSTGFGRVFFNFLKGIDSCEAKEGQCYYDSCGNLRAIPAGDAGCERKLDDPNAVCCEPLESKTGERGYGANSELIKVTLNSAKTSLSYGTTEDLDIGKTYYINILLNDKLKQLMGEDGKHCAVWLEDRDLSETYAITKMDKVIKSGFDKTMEAPLLTDEDKFLKVNEDGSLIHVCKPSDDKLILNTRVFTPQEQNAGRSYLLRIIVFNSTVSEAIKDEGQKVGEKTDKAIKERDYWVAEFSTILRPEPIVEIKGISTKWVAEDDITVTANDPYKLSSVMIAIVPGDKEAIKQKDDKSLYQNVYDACKALGDSKYHALLHKISSTKAGTEGINLIFVDIGKKNYQTEMYQSTTEGINIINEQKEAKVHIDASTIAETFKIDDMLEEKEISAKEGLKEQYLCVKTDIVGPDGKVRPLYSASQQPLRIDVAPPLISNTDAYIQVSYPEPRLLADNMQNLLNQGVLQQGQSATSRYFNEYPKLIIKKCIDKSGCKNYDYYFAETTIPVIATTPDIETGIVAEILSLGLNSLYNYLITRNPLKSICPLANSNQYRTNTHPEIRFSQHEQGVFCIRVKDAVGNYWLTWKTAYNPYDILEAVVGEVIEDTNITPSVGS